MQRIDEAELLEKLGDQFGFSHFIVLGAIPVSHDESDLHMIFSPGLSYMNATFFCIEALQNMVSALGEPDQSVH